MERLITTQEGPGICNVCDSIVTHIAVFEGSSNHPAKRGTFCPVCDDLKTLRRYAEDALRKMASPEELAIIDVLLGVLPE
jgi:hypothetical protein